MPVEFLVVGAADDSLVTFINDVPDQEEIFILPFEPVSVEFDPDVKILSTAVLGVDEQTYPPQGGVGTMYLGPNPASLNCTINWQGTGDMALQVRIYDLSGRIVQRRVLAPSSRLLDLTGISACTYLLDAIEPGNVRHTDRLIILGN